MNSLLLMETIKSQLTAEQPLTKRGKKNPKPLWNLPKKISYIQKQRKMHSEMVGEA